MLRPEGANALQIVLLIETRETRDMLQLFLRRMREKRDMLDGSAPQNEGKKRHVG